MAMRTDLEPQTLEEILAAGVEVQALGILPYDLHSKWSRVSSVTDSVLFNSETILKNPPETEKYQHALERITKLLDAPSQELIETFISYNDTIYTDSDKPRRNALRPDQIMGLRFDPEKSKIMPIVSMTADDISTYNALQTEANTRAASGKTIKKEWKRKKLKTLSAVYDAGKQRLVELEKQRQAELKNQARPPHTAKTDKTAEELLVEGVSLDQYQFDVEAGVPINADASTAAWAAQQAQNFPIVKFKQLLQAEQNGTLPDADIQALARLKKQYFLDNVPFFEQPMKGKTLRAAIPVRFIESFQYSIKDGKVYATPRVKDNTAPRNAGKPQKKHREAREHMLSIIRSTVIDGVKPTTQALAKQAKQVQGSRTETGKASNQPEFHDIDDLEDSLGDGDLSYEYLNKLEDERFKYRTKDPNNNVYEARIDSFDAQPPSPPSDAAPTNPSDARREAREAKWAQIRAMAEANKAANLQQSPSPDKTASDATPSTGTQLQVPSHVRNPSTVNEDIQSQADQYARMKTINDSDADEQARKTKETKIAKQSQVMEQQQQQIEPNDPKFPQ